MCQLHHGRKTKRDRDKRLLLPEDVRAPKRTARRGKIALNLCIISKCVSPAVKFYKCFEHLTPNQKESGMPKKRKSAFAGTPEYATIQAHLQCIRTSHLTKNATYRDMPFYAAWNKREGGSILAGAKWLIENLGGKPSGSYELHIIDRRLGFVPGNLAWVPRADHKREEMLTKLLIENRELKARVDALEERVKTHYELP